MLSKTWIGISVGLLVLMGVYSAFNPSYERSIEAKFYYAIGEYKSAHKLAKEAFELDSYNRMAATIMTQSQTALLFVDYIAEAKKYMKDISSLAEAASISEADRSKIKLICEIMIDSYVKISPTVLTDEELVQESRYYYEQFVQLHEKVTETL